MGVKGVLKAVPPSVTLCSWGFQKVDPLLSVSGTGAERGVERSARSWNVRRGAGCRAMEVVVVVGASGLTGKRQKIGSASVKSRPPLSKTKHFPRAG